MKAAVVEGSSPPYRLVVKDVEPPKPKKDEVLVRVKAAGLTNIDQQMLDGSMERAVKRLSKRSEVLTGIEFSGIVESDGKKFKKGEHVIAAIDYLNGVRAHAEYTVVPEQYLGHKPAAWSHVEAASVPTGLITTIEGERERERERERENDGLVLLLDFGKKRWRSGGETVIFEGARWNGLTVDKER